MPSLSSYDRGKRSFEGRRYKKDIESVRKAMALLCEPWYGAKGYEPLRVLTLGNHEDRITRAIEEDAKLDGTMSLDDLGYEAWGWEVYPFLEPVRLDGISYVHYWPSGVKGNPASSASAMLSKAGVSVTVGHIQTFDFAVRTRGDGQRIHGLMAGAYYQHDEDYLPGPQNAATVRQVVMKHEVDGRGGYDIMCVSLGYLKRKYGK